MTLRLLDNIRIVDIVIKDITRGEILIHVQLISINTLATKDTLFITIWDKIWMIKIIPTHDMLIYNLSVSSNIVMISFLQ